MNSNVNTDRMILKEKAINYFKENGIPKIVEKSLNDLFKDYPEDACGYLCKYYEKLSQDPQLSKVKVFETIGDFGLNTISIILYGIFCNEEIELVRLNIANNFIVKTGDIITMECILIHENNTKECIKVIKDDLSKLFIGVDPRNQDCIEQLLRIDGCKKQLKYEEECQVVNDSDVNKDEIKKDDAKSKVVSGKNKKSATAVVVIPDDPAEVICPYLRAHFSMSIAMAMMASVVVKEDLYKYTLNRLPSNIIPSITLPAISVIFNGKGIPGKCQVIKRCILVPNGIYDPSATQIANDLRLMHMKLWIAIVTKYPTTISNDRGELMPSFDKPEQFLDIIQEVLKESELEERIKIILEIGANGIFDINKGKYEIIIGQLKSSDEMVTFLKDLVDRYPIIVGLVNPLRKQDTQQWKDLTKILSDRCWIIGRTPQIFPRVQKISENLQFLEENLTKSSIIGIDIDGYSLYGDYISCATRFHEADQKMCIWFEDLCGQNWLMDLALGLRPYLIVIPSLRCASGASKLDRWVELMSSISSISNLNFPILYQDIEEESNKALIE